ncbi:laminin EGF-like protein, partial [Ostertagia ostertagi]
MVAIAPSLANGLQYEKVNVTIDLRQEYQVAYVVVKMGNAPRPGTWVLEKSLDGIHYDPWQYYATSDAECMRQFGVPATTGVPRFQRDDEVHCTSEYSKITPLEGGEIHTSLVNGRPGVEKPSLELQVKGPCADGFFGNPMLPNGTCKECECNGNIDLMAIGNCDTETGVCLKCIGDTTGEHCELCKENHWGSALEKTCKPCGCHHVGAESPQCGNEYGECKCKPNYIGKQCDRCIDGHGDIENGCPACECNMIGSIGDQCDAVSGQCTCKQGVFGKRCDQCRPSYFNFTDAGCQFCHCNIYGSIEDGKCNNITGKCECRSNVDGTMCEKCADGFFNITSGVGCQACECDATGSDGEACDLHSGQCVCKPGVTGLKCDHCQPNHYGLGPDGCKECRACPAPGQVCDSVTGECVCPPNTVGEMCENCTENAWDYHPLKGCKLCECSDVGSSNGKCDMRTGQCKCRNEYVGLRCDLCTHGFFGFPNCQPCNCEPNGTDPLQCKDGLCLCNEEGECPCKEKRDGVAKAIRLQGVPPASKALFYGKQTYAEDRRAVFEEPWEYYTKKHNLNLLKEYPARYNSYPTDAVPLYWPLPKSMLGDRTSSYNGFLRFK